PEEVSADGGGVAEDPDAEDDHDRGRELAAHAQFVAEEHDQRRHGHVGDERDDEHLRVEDPVQSCAQATEYRVERCHDRDRAVRLEPAWDRRAQDQPEHDPDCQRQSGDHRDTTFAYRTFTEALAGKVRWSESAKEKPMWSTLRSV